MRESDPTIQDVLATSVAIGRQGDQGYWPPLTLRGTIRSCDEHGDRHFHYEAIGALRGGAGVVMHVFCPEHYPSETVALAMLHHFAEACGIAREDVRVVDHDTFDHSVRPEVEGVDTD